jgi:alpha-galactosidase
VTPRGQLLRWSPEGRLTVALRIDGSGPVRLGGLWPAGLAAGNAAERSVPLVEVACDASGRAGNSAAAQHRPYAATQALRYVDHHEQAVADGVALEVVQCDEGSGLEVRTRLLQVAGTPVLQVASEVVNTGRQDLTLTYVSSLSLTGFGPGLDALRLRVARNAWTAELRWQSLTAEQAGLVDIGALHEGQGTSKARYAVTAPTSWSSGGFLPMGAVEDLHDGIAWVWQVEHHGGWHWEVGDLHGDLYLLASGPTDLEHQWRQPLAPGERFATVPVAVAAVRGGLADGLRALTGYRRATRRPSQDNRRLPVIFNDYMNCLMGDPTEERLAPLVEAAAKAGAEYFVIDAGWYADDASWWDAVGEWLPSSVRFPSGLGVTLQRIRDAGMAPGLWLEPEVVGVHSPLAEKLPDEAFFTEGGQRRQENGRFHLDYRCDEVRGHMDEVVDRLVGGYGVEYLKLDCNIAVAPGTDALQESPGAGLLGHNRAYLAWLDGVLERHPDLVLENCASGGMRMDYALLRRLSIQSTSDQRDPLLYVPIAAAAPSAVTPEQAAVWAYPQAEHSPEEASLCLVNALLGRVHLSGRIDLMSEPQLERVRTAIRTYKDHRRLLAGGQPHWPLGLPGWYDRWLALAIDHPAACLLAVWYRGAGPGTVTLRMPWLAGGGWLAEVLFPTDLPADLSWAAGTDRTLQVTLPDGPAARVIRLRRAGTRPDTHPTS